MPQEASAIPGLISHEENMLHCRTSQRAYPDDLSATGRLTSPLFMRRVLHHENVPFMIYGEDLKDI
jgi:hypothetical protein